ncbi:MAG: 1-deoxy-D-xylulose-5-phosphate reductoisomerase [Clostridiales bacterium]|nr:1-deoxy-D-xylulose-5-phosphate reductoisomerase [Clostridiales bacterium]
MRKIAVLGATGSIGTQTLDIIEKHPEMFRAEALSAATSAEKLFGLARKFRPRFCALQRETAVPEDLSGIEWFFGADANEKMLLAARPDDALCAVVGIAGLNSVLTALDVCERVLLANKEALVTGGRLVMDKSARLHRELLPVDSEHSAIFQCLKARENNTVKKLILTCSGGAFRTWDKAAIYGAKASDALKHPTWKMGGKITADCASLMNKGLEIIEASYLFGMPEDRIDVVIHPESVIHSMIEFTDGAYLAQLACPDMRGPISYALGHPQRLEYGGKELDFAQIGRLSFFEPDTDTFPCLEYAREAIRRGGAYPVILNGANEEAVSAFLKNMIPFGKIAETVRHALDTCPDAPVNSAEEVLDADRTAREAARRYLEDK